MSLPRKWIEERDPSPDALCGRYDPFLEGYCAAPVKLLISRNAFASRPWAAYVIEECTAGHMHHAQGVPLDLSVFADEDADDGNTAYGV